jgi:hypothetical protein
MGTAIPVKGPSVWTRGDLACETDWIRPLDAADLEDIDRAMAATAGMHLLELDARRFALPRFGRKLAAIAEELENGRGIVQIRGLPVARYSRDDCKRMIWGIGTHLGTGLSQSKRGDFLGEVTDLGVEMARSDARAYRSKGVSRFHTDRCDVVGLLCVVKARKGGESRVVSAPAVHNEVLRRRPDLLEVLYGDFHHSRQGEEAAGEARSFASPVFAFRDGKFASQMSFLYTESAQRFPEVPRMSEAQQEAMALIAQVADELYVESPFEPGDLQLLNNHLAWHCRTGYEDDDAPDKRRLLYRLWLATPNSRALPQKFLDSWGSIEPGAVRGGVISAGGWRIPRLSKEFT